MLQSILRKIHLFQFVPSVDMSLVWASSSSSLSITISKISNLPPKLTKSHISATIRLVPRQSSFDQETVPFSPPTTPMKPPSSLHGMECPSGSSTPRGSFSMPRGHRFSISSLSSPDLNQSTSKYKIRKTLDDNFSQIFTFAGQLISLDFKGNNRYSVKYIETHYNRAM